MGERGPQQPCRRRYHQRVGQQPRLRAAPETTRASTNAAADDEKRKGGEVGGETGKLPD